MTKLKFEPAAENQEHLNRHSDYKSLNPGSKALETTTPEDIATLLTKSDNAFKQAIEEQGNPGRTVYSSKADRWVGTDAIVPAEELKDGSVFTIVREPGTPYQSEIKVALISPADMPKTNVVHAIYGPKGETGGIYTMVFGDPGMPFPKKLDENADEGYKKFNQKCDEYWNGTDGKGGHIFLVTPDELAEAIKKMQEKDLNTIIASTRLKNFEKKPESPIIHHKPSEIAKDSVYLGKVYLTPLPQNIKNKYSSVNRE